SIADRTYYFKKDVGIQKSLVIIAVHFKADYKDSDHSIVIVDGIWQISDISTEIKTDTVYDTMEISTVSADTIVMENQDAVTLGKNKSINLMDDLMIKTADTEELKYYIYKNIQNPGEYEIRGTVATSDFIWNPQNFAGFYYDMNDNIGTEHITATITEENKLQEPSGIVYSTAAQRTAFKFEGWGYYNVIGFMAEPYLAGYLLDKELPAEDQVLHTKSTDECSLCDEQLQKILMDNDDERVVKKGDIIELGEGYDLIIKGISGEGTWYLELRKDGQIIDSDVKSSSKTGTMLHSTYYYRKDVGAQKDLLIIAVHFRNNYNDGENSSAIIDGIWQISDNATKVGTGTEYGKMRVSTVSADTIIMNNQYNTIILSKNKNIDLMEDVIIKTADAENLRYYVYKTVTIVPRN
ncbi:MAG: S-layer protein, partial [Methanotrichaceae archaeon]|nr:S-layer protein [Methanotrichaceae archaeon]